MNQGTYTSLMFKSPIFSEGSTFNDSLNLFIDNTHYSDKIVLSYIMG